MEEPGITRKDIDSLLELLGRIADSLDGILRVQEERERLEKKESGEGGLDLGEKKPEA